MNQNAYRMKKEIKKNVDLSYLLAPICGGGNPDRVHELSDTPVWAFHGAKDSVVPLEETEKMVNKLQSCGGNIKLTVYPEADHDSWTETYNNPELYTWFLRYSL